MNNVPLLNIDSYKPGAVSGIAEFPEVNSLKKKLILHERRVALRYQRRI